MPYESRDNSTPVCIADLIPFEIPESWEWARLGEISDYSGKKIKISPTAISSDTWCLDLEDIEKGGRIYQKRTLGDKKPSGDKTVFLKGQILYSKLRPYLLKILVAPQDGVCTSEIVPFNIWGNLSSEYVVTVLKTPYVDCLVNSTTFGIKMPRVSTETMNNLFIPIPPLSEQRRIVAKLEELLPLVEEYGKAESTLTTLNATFPEALKKSILQDAVQGKLVPQDPDEEPASVLLERIRREKKALDKTKKGKRNPVESRIVRRDNSYYELRDGVERCVDDLLPFEIPDSWEWARLGEVMSNFTGLSYKKEQLNVKGAQMVRVLRGGNILYDRYVFKDDDVKIASDFVKTELYLKKGFFITPAVSSLEQIGKVALIDQDFNDVVAGGFVLVLKPLFANFDFCKYLYYVFSTKYHRDNCRGVTHKSGQAFYNLSREKLMNLFIPIPPLAEQRRIVAKLEEIFKHLDLQELN